MRAIANATNSIRIPAAAGTIYAIRVDGLAGRQGKIQLNWAFGSAPTLLARPSHRRVFEKQAVKLAIEATGVPAPSYQWRRNLIDLEGRTWPVLDLMDLKFSDAGSYSVVVSNPLGSVSTDPIPANLSVRPGIGLAGAVSPVVLRAFRMNFPGAEVEDAFIIEASTDLLNWHSIFTNVPGQAAFEFSDTNAVKTPWQFYRAMLPN
ncbi:MAG: hypothetical protein EXS31_13750 [Pedosphaera sp.]|nr:hypothetical protein [Pedosphaera sp.]